MSWLSASRILSHLILTRTLRDNGKPQFRVEKVRFREVKMAEPEFESR